MIERSGKIEAIFEGCHVSRARDPYLFPGVTVRERGAWVDK